MTKTTLIATALIALSMSVNAGTNDLELIPGRLFHEGDYYEQVFTLKNNTKRRLEAVYFECGVFDADGLIDTHSLIFHNVPPNGEAYDKTGSDRGHVVRIDCRLLNAD